ncbi:MAG TPA: ribosome maturation factor RimP [Acidimicrobiales bacterium]|nr:ribosome maturation factor RimP [Acidimicrobiales bacterium]
MSLGDRVRAVVEAPLATSELELVDVEHTGNLLRVTVDRPGGVDLDTISEASRLVSEALDRTDVVPGRYVLEVSSPGVERPLRTPEHFHRFVGTTVAVRTRAGTDGDRRVEGELEGADDEGVVVAGRRLAYGEIERARTVFVWEPAAKPGKGAKGKAKAGSGRPR